MIPDAARHFAAAIELDARNTPAYLNLGDVQFLQGDAAVGAVPPTADLVRSAAQDPSRAGD